MIELEKYKKISSIGKQIGYLFDYSCDNYKIKSSVTYASKNYFVTSDGNDFLTVFSHALEKAKEVNAEIVIKSM